MSTILLKFASPLQAWGTDSNFNIRHTDLHPSKSALIGMIGAAMGYKRDQDKEIQALNSLDFGVRSDQIANITSDYQIARNEYIEKEVYLTKRYYLEDSIFLVAIGSSDEKLIENIEYALKHPYFQLFLGRKSVPINADFFLGNNDKSVLENLKTYPWLASDWYKKKSPKNLSIFVDGDLVDDEELIKYGEMRKDRVVSFSQKERIFKNRNEVRVDLPLRDVYKEENYKKDQALEDRESKHDIFGNIRE
ncbi:MAG: type I-E CRISPR-associated protein Cas5/CasD [Anaerococcus sp.]|nr:type I-E CRISPR-associated protein Cas5/CasD [Anaerococcus sp.]